MAFLDKISAPSPAKPADDDEDELDDLFGAKSSAPSTEPKPSGSSSSKITGFSLKASSAAQESKKPVGGPMVAKHTAYLHEYSYNPEKLPPALAGAQGNPLTLFSKEKVSVETGSLMRTLLFGNSKGSFMKSWRQGFFYSTAVRCGLHQTLGGPCGVLAVVQAHVFKHLLYIGKSGLQPSLEARTIALMASLTDILIQAAGQPVAVKADKAPRYTIYLAMPNLEPPGLPLLPAQCELYKVSKYTWDELFRLLCSLLGVFTEPSGQGVVLLLYSVLFTHGIEKVKAEMDRDDCSLITPHGYASQELINLMMMGQATTNVFDGEKEIDDLKLRGAPCQSEIGFLTILEAYRYFEVGQRLKTPKLPIWVVCSESHYSVLFADDLHVLNKLFGPFSVLYYDGLAKQEFLIQIGVARKIEASFAVKVDLTHNKSLAPLEAVIMTRWGSGLNITWLNSDPIL